MLPNKKVDKGKRQMVENDIENERRVTRPRTTGIVISEPQTEPTLDEQRREEPESDETYMPDLEPHLEEVMVEEEERLSHLREEVRERVRAEPSRVAPTEARIDGDQRMDRMMEMMEGMTRIMTQLVQAQQRVSSGPSTSPARPVQQTVQPQDEVEVEEAEPIRQERQMRAPERPLDIRVFQDMKPPTYHGEKNYKVADDWVKELETIFEYFPCTEEQKVLYAAFTLRGDAADWWRSERETLTRRGRHLQWAEFVDRFFHHYIPASEKMRKAAEFASLVQGKMTVGEYESHFRSLSCFMAWTHTDQMERARKFQEGLKLSIRAKVAAFRLTNYADILDLALTIEREEEEITKHYERRKATEQKRRGSGRGRFFGRGRGQRDAQRAGVG